MQVVKREAKKTERSLKYTGYNCQEVANLLGDQHLTGNDECCRTQIYYVQTTDRGLRELIPGYTVRVGSNSVEVIEGPQ